MKKKPKHPTKKELKRLMDFSDQMEFLFAVNNYNRSFTWKEEDIEKSEAIVAAQIMISVPYQRISIEIYPAFWTQSLKEQREILLHEFCHTIIQPIQVVAEDLFKGRFRTEKESKDAVEHSTSRVFQLLDFLLRGRLKYARKAYRKYLLK